MNNVQIMSTSPQAGSVKANVKSASKVTSAKSTSRSSGFDDVLEKSQTQPEAKTDVQAKDANVQKQDAKVADSSVKDAAAEAKDARDAAAVAEVTAKTTDANGAKKTATSKDAKGTTVTDDANDAVDEALAADVASSILAAKLTAAQTLLLGEMKSLVKDAIGAKGQTAAAVEDLAQAILDASTQKAMSESSSLMSLLPQNMTDSKAQQTMLAMLAGQNTGTQAAKAVIASLLADNANATDSSELLANLQNLMADAAKTQGTVAQALSTQALTAQNQNAFASLQSFATPVATQTVQAAPLFASLQNAQPKTDAQANVSDFANLLGTDVEAATESVDLGQQVLAAFQQQAGTNADAQQQGAQQQAMAEMLMTQNGEQAVTQLQEEAAFDKASAAQETAQAPAAGITSFAQTLQAVDGTPQSAAPQAAQQPRTDYDIPQQIVDQARLIQRGQETEMVIHLKPEHLGDLTLRVSVGANGAVNASFHSNNAEVRTIIENTLVQLKQELNNQGLKVDNVGVYAGLADGGLPQQEQGQQQAFQQGGGRQHSTKESAEAFEDGQELASALAAQKENAATDGVDYRV